jgi:hypothetical protein
MMRTIFGIVVVVALLLLPATAARAGEPVGLDRTIIYTMAEPTRTDQDLNLARRVGSEVLVRAWFKWHDAWDFAALAPLVPKAHAAGALLGGGVTCSALYDGENGLSAVDVLDMATRGPVGERVDAWNTPGCRHGTLSNPRYLQYVLSWCYQQIDAGADYLFMDEIDAALHRNEGFDDYSVGDFREYLLRRYGAEGEGWAGDDARWGARFKVNLADRSIASDGTVRSFAYRAYLKANGWTADPHAAANPLARDWARCRKERDDRAWKQMTDAIRAYARSKGRPVYISGNGLAKYVDLQVLGVWGLFDAKEGEPDFSVERMLDWSSAVRRGRAMVGGRRVPVVFFHDWGFGGFPWLRLAPAQRTLWNRIRGAELFAAGAIYAWPVLGPSGCNAGRDGTLDEIAHQAAFYRENRALYVDGDVRGVEAVTASQPLVSTSLWSRGGKEPALIVHVVNRQVAGGALRRRTDLALRVPTPVLPRSVRVVSPDWAGVRTARVESAPGGSGGIRLLLPELDAYAVAILEYEGALPALHMDGDRILVDRRWERPEVNQFEVDRDGRINAPEELHGLLQGKLHAELANPPTFNVNAAGPAKLSVKLRSVATLGARLEWVVDGSLVRSEAIPDLDHKNDSAATEYDKVLDFPIPPGKHSVILRNTGGDWVVLDWYRFSGLGG